MYYGTTKYNVEGCVDGSTKNHTNYMYMQIYGWQ